MGVFVGTAAPETLDGTNDDDSLYGLGGDDTLNALDGNDFLDGGSGNDTLNGDAGNDVFVVDSLSDIVNEDDGEGFDTVYALANYALGAAAYVELLSAADHSLTSPLNLTGNDHTVSILGNNGVNVLTGGANGEILYGFAGADTLNGGGGGDYLAGGSGSDTLNGDADNDFLDGGTGGDAMAGGGGDDVYVVDSSGDTVSEASGDGFDIVYALTSHGLAAAASVERLSAVDHVSTVALNLTGGNGDTQILGNNGLNILTGGTGNDSILGFAGDDTLNGGDGNDALFGMAGFDTLLGGIGNDFLDGGSGPTDMRGGAGNDVYVIRDSADVIAESSAGNDIAYALVDYNLPGEVETLAAVDLTAVSTMRLFGGDTANVVLGDAGDNLLDGRHGADYLRGYGGADIFNFSDTVYSTMPGGLNTPADTIADFQPGVDRIRLDSTQFVGVLGNASFFEVGATATHPETRILYDPATGALYYDQNGNEPPPPDNPVKFAQITPGLTLTAADFIVEDNHAPEANPDFYAISFAGDDVAVTVWMKQNDFDTDGLRLWVTKLGAAGQPLVTVGTGLSATLVNGTYGFMFGGGKSNEFSYRLDADDPDTMALTPGQTVTDNFVYEITDGETDAGGGGPGGSFTPYALFAQSTITVTITRAADGSVSSSIAAPKQSGGEPDNLAPASAFEPAHDHAPHAAELDATAAARWPHPPLAMLGMDVALV